MKNAFFVILLGLSGCFTSDPVAVVPTEQEIAAQKISELEAHIQETQARVVRTQGLIDQAKDQGLQNEIEIVTLKTDVRYSTSVVYSAKKERDKLEATGLEVNKAEEPVKSQTGLVGQINHINSELVLVDKCLVEAKEVGAQYAIDKLLETKDFWVNELKRAKNQIAGRTPSPSQITSAAD